MAIPITKTNLTIREAESEDRNRLANLTHFESYVHRHLDWRGPLEWIGSRPFLVLELGKEIVAALACPPDAPEIAWIRLYAAGHAVSASQAWSNLWPEAQNQLIDLDYTGPIAAIPLWPWFAELLAQSGFSEVDRVVMLAWQAGSPTPSSGSARVTLRPMIYNDLQEVQSIDEQSFGPIWQNSQASLELAYRQAVVASVAQFEGRLVGYQISTSTPVGGHLARLAVLPNYQGQGIGRELVRDLIVNFNLRGAQRITVNTQKNNQSSLSLYQKMAFKLTGEDYSVMEWSQSG